MRRVVLGVLLAGITVTFVPCRSHGDEGHDQQTLFWYRGNTHTHTNNSGDGDSFPIDVARWYREHKYQFLIITDHDYLTDVSPINAAVGAKDKFLVLPGEEITQQTLDPTRIRSFNSPEIGAPLHVNALFSSALIEPIGERKCFKEGGCLVAAPPERPVQELYRRNLQTIKEQGAIGQINHPNFYWTARPDDLSGAPDGSLIEVWNIDSNSLGGDDGEGHVSPPAEFFLDWMLSHGKVAWAVAADDSHVFKTDIVESDAARQLQGTGWIVVRAPDLTADHIKTAIAAGNFYASNGVELKDIRRDDKALRLSINTPAPSKAGAFTYHRYSTTFIGQSGQILATVAGLDPSYLFTGRESYVRAVVTDGMGLHAWTQPVFLDGRRSRSPYGAVVSPASK